jgi:hypothetical protein
MARSITVLIKMDGTGGKNAGLEINAGTKRWEKFESGNANHVFTTKKGPYRFVGSGGSGDTELLRDGGGKRVGMLDSFNPETVAEGADGQGLSDEAGNSFTWRVDKIADI